MAVERLQLSIDDVSLGDLEEFEEYTGMPFTMIDQVQALIESGQMTTKLLTGMALLALRQDNPDATIEDAKRVKITQLMGATDDPTQAEPTKLEPLAGGAGRRGKRTTA